MDRLWNVLRPLVPFFRFFDDVGPVSKIFYRPLPLHAPDTPWTQAFVSSQPRRWRNLLLNQNENHRLWMVSQFERLVFESQNYIKRPRDFSRHSIYKQCHQLLSQEARTGQLQFKIQNHLGDDVFVSSSYGDTDA
jgi:hypothetical protein